ncbi:MAG: hypothetical protein LBS51_04175 [Oscillospiraceae bacterium]|nr:hypothetical protein [Oscillospiraceae bacterium]
MVIKCLTRTNTIMGIRTNTITIMGIRTRTSTIMTARRVDPSRQRTRRSCGTCSDTTGVTLRKCAI